jgi:hypothetical protein
MITKVVTFAFHGLKFSRVDRWELEYNDEET